jgi:hypothetical protein
VGDAVAGRGLVNGKNFLGRVLPLRVCGGHGTHAFQQVASEGIVSEDLRDCAGKCGRIIRRDQYSSFSVSHVLRQTTHIRSDNGLVQSERSENNTALTCLDIRARDNGRALTQRNEALI